jgi:hypothetical protein
MSTTDITVPVPADRVPEFYRWFADWVDGKVVDASSPSAEATDEPDLSAAVRWWNLLKPRERRIFSLWIDAAPRMLTATEIIKELDLTGPREIAGILSWPGRKGKKAGFGVHWSFRYDAITEEPIYGIEDSEYAELLGRARTAAEGK